MPIDEVHKAAILAARTLIEKDPGYTRATARLLLHTIRREILGEEVLAGRHGDALRRVLPAVHQAGHRGRAARREAAPVRPGPPRRGARRRPRPAVRLPRPADAVRPLLPAHRRGAHRAAAGVLHARGDGPGAERDRPRGARHRVLQRAVELRLHELDADAVQLRHAPLAALELLPDDGVRRPRRHLRGDQGERAAVEVRRRPRQRLDPRARARQLHQGHQRQEPGRGAVPEGRQRHRGRGQPGRQAQGRGLRLPRDLAPRHRGVPRAAQEHRRRPPPHARHEHRQLDSRPVHEAGDGRRRLDAVLALGPAPTCTTSSARRSRTAYIGLRGQGRARRDQAVQEDAGRRPVAQDAVDAVRDRPSLDHVQGRLQRALAAAARRRRALVATCAPRSRSTPATTRSRSATSARSTCAQHVDATARSTRPS